MRDPIVDELVMKYWAGLMNGDRLDVRIGRFENMMDDVIAECRVVCAFAELAAKESTATATRAAAAKRDDAARLERGEKMLGGMTLVTKHAHIDAVSKKIQAQSVAAEAERLRKTVAATAEDLAQAQRELAAQGASAPPQRRSTLEADVESKEAEAALARVNLSEAEDLLRKLQAR